MAKQLKTLVAELNKMASFQAELSGSGRERTVVVQDTPGVIVYRWSARSQTVAALEAKLETIKELERLGLPTEGPWSPLRTPAQRELQAAAEARWRAAEQEEREQALRDRASRPRRELPDTLLVKCWPKGNVFNATVVHEARTYGRADSIEGREYAIADAISNSLEHLDRYGRVDARDFFGRLRLNSRYHNGHVGQAAAEAAWRGWKAHVRRTYGCSATDLEARTEGAAERPLAAQS